MALGKIKIKIKTPTPTAAERFHAAQQKNRKAAGLPDPSEYKKKLDSMKTEQLEKKGRFVSGPVKQPFKSNTVVTPVKEAADEPITIVKKGTNIKKKISADTYNVFKHHGFRKEEKDSREYDYEGDMAKSDLRSIIHNAQTLHDMLDDDTNLAEWCQSKITLAEDYISTVTNYMRSEMKEEVKDEYARKVDKYLKKKYDKKQPQGADFAAQRRKERLAKNGRMDEDAEQLDEISSGLKASYVAGAKKQIKQSVPFTKKGEEYRDIAKNFIAKREKGIARANEEVEQMDEKKNLPGLWANIHAKRKRGESPAKPGDKDYPKTLNIESAQEPTEGEMKDKQGYSRKAKIVMNAAKGKKSDSPEKFQKDPELSSEIHKT